MLKTFLDTNTFGRNLTIKKHYFDDDRDVEVVAHVGLPMHIALWSLLSDFHSGSCVLWRTYHVKVLGMSLVSLSFQAMLKVFFFKSSHFNPIGARCTGIDKLQKLFERSLSSLSLQTSMDTCTDRDNLSGREKRALKDLLLLLRIQIREV